MTGLPGWLAEALQARLENISRTGLRASAQRISDRYRAGGGSDIIRSEFDALAYAVVRMPATYAAVRAALAQTAAIIADFAPRTLLDIGAGPGTASWAAIDAWPTLERALLIDANPHLLALAAAFGRSAAIATTTTRGALGQTLGNATSAEVVTASFVLTELAGSALIGTLERLWELSQRLLVIVEPGTPDGFKRILACRDALIARGAEIVAPCSHAGRCPLATAERWCHFNARLPRSRDHIAAKEADVPFEDEKFAYLVAGKGLDAFTRGHRILATPRVDKSAVTLTLCAPETPAQHRIARGDKDAYRAAKRLDWGDAVDWNADITRPTSLRP
ncbi:MAG TPA: small ribosomal subunit Rsm22 family protein [Pseudolabrys sp.]|nr:small ribosomal subunit Rsm22 family protein [Pseudolabrys sp.]